LEESDWERVSGCVWVDLRVRFVLFFLKDLEVMWVDLEVIFVKVWERFDWCDGLKNVLLEVIIKLPFSP